MSFVVRINDRDGTQPGGAPITITDPPGAVSTKCSDSLGEVVSDDATMRTVYAGPHILTSEPDDDGESMFISGM